MIVQPKLQEVRRYGRRNPLPALNAAGLQMALALDAQAAAPNAPVNYAGFFTGVLQYIRADSSSNTKTGAVVNTLADLSGNGANITEGSAGVGIGTLGTLSNGKLYLQANGSTQWGTYNLALAAPGTTPTFFWSIWRLDAAAGGSIAWFTNGASNAQAVFINTSSQNLFTNGGTGSLGPIALTLGTWGRSEFYFSNSASDYLKFGPTTAGLIGTSGNSTTTARGLFAQPAGTGKMAASLLVHIALNNKPSTTALNNAVAAANAEFGLTLN